MDVHFNAYKIKYKLLQEFIRPVTSSQNISNMNIFINLDDLFHRLHNNITDREFQHCGVDASKQLVSNIFNLVAHYRNFSMKLGIEPKIFVIYTNSRVFKNTRHVSTYRNHYLNITEKDNGAFYYVNSTIRENMSFAHMISKYLPNVYIINSSWIEPSAIPLYLSNKFQADHNMYISRDEYDFQYAYRTGWSFIIPKGDNSTLINKKNIWNYIANREKIYDYNLKYDPELFLIMKGIVGDRYRTIPRLKRCGWKTIFNYMEDITNDIEDSQTSIEFQKENTYRVLEKFIHSKSIPPEDINNNVFAIDVDRQMSILIDTDKVIIDSQIEDMEDYRELERLNDSIFKSFPLNLAFLTREKKVFENKKQMNYGYSII